jgi:hypothetical protein
LPPGQRRRDVFLLAFLCSSANQDYKPVSVFAEVDPVAWTKIDSVLVSTGPTPFALETLPCWMRARAAATLAAASLFKRSDHAANGLCPVRSRYSRTSTITNGNTYGTIVKGLVSFMDYDLGYFDLETRVLEPLENPFGPKVLPMS